MDNGVFSEQNDFSRGTNQPFLRITPELLSSGKLLDCPSDGICPLRVHNPNILILNFVEFDCTSGK
jgi:hypothetical protein